MSKSKGELLRHLDRLEPGDLLAGNLEDGSRFVAMMIYYGDYWANVPGENHERIQGSADDVAAWLEGKQVESISKLDDTEGGDDE